MARTLGPRDDVHLRTLSRSLGWPSGPEPHTFFVFGVQSHLPDYISVLRVPLLLITWAPVPHLLPVVQPPIGLHGHPITEPSSPSPGVFFLADWGATKEMGGPAACCLSRPCLAPSV